MQATLYFSTRPAGAPPAPSATAAYGAACDTNILVRGAIHNLGVTPLSPVLAAVGTWEGETEPAFILEVKEGRSCYSITDTAKDLAAVYNQNAVAVFCPHDAPAGERNDYTPAIRVTASIPGGDIPAAFALLALTGEPGATIRPVPGVGVEVTFLAHNEVPALCEAIGTRAYLTFEYGYRAFVEQDGRVPTVANVVTPADIPPTAFERWAKENGYEVGSADLVAVTPPVAIGQDRYNGRTSDDVRRRYFPGQV